MYQTTVTIIIILLSSSAEVCSPLYNRFLPHVYYSYSNALEYLNLP
jgi:hypothetical protein